METLLSALSHHGYSILMAIVFLEAIGLPSPAALALLIAGGLSATGTRTHPLNPLFTPWLVFLCAFTAMAIADTLMFLIGRYTGWWLLGMLCRLSLNPESCILRSAESFYKRGRTLLLFAKFVPGINTMAPPLAGSMNMRITHFLRLDLVGAALYVGSWFGVGYLFSDALDAITRGYHVFGQILGWIVMVALAGYVLYQVWVWTRSRRLPPVPFVSPEQVAEPLASNNVLIYDVRSHGYYEAGATRIQGSRRLEPNALRQLEQQLIEEQLPGPRQVYLYCTCIREATSSRVARELIKKGIPSAVIEGGLAAWKKAGLPMERVPTSEIVLLPVFES